MERRSTFFCKFVKVLCKAESFIDFNSLKRCLPGFINAVSSEIVCFFFPFFPSNRENILQEVLHRKMPLGNYRDRGLPPTKGFDFNLLVQARRMTKQQGSKDETKHLFVGQCRFVVAVVVDRVLVAA